MQTSQWCQNIFIVCQKEKQKHEGVEKIKPHTFKKESLMQHMVTVNIFSFNTYVGSIICLPLAQNVIIEILFHERTKKFQKATTSFQLFYLFYGKQPQQ